MKCILFVFMSFFSAMLIGQREVQDLCNDWQFRLAEEDFKLVNIPHTYNADDPFDDAPGYYRGKAFYQKIIDTRNWDREKQHYLKFYGVNQKAIVYLNGKVTAEHWGGYTSFVAGLVNSKLHFESDTILVEVDNSHEDAIPPLMGDFNFYGGIYRKVEMISVPETHFSTDIFGADGVFIDPVEIDSVKASILIRSYVENFMEDKHEIRVEIQNGDMDQILETSFFEQNEKNNTWQMQVDVWNPELWSDENPSLYYIVLSIKDKNTSEILDKLSIPYGFRYFRFDPDKGFFMNGRYRKLIGVNRHQDRPGIGNALTPDQHIQDMDIIRDMGANFLRTAHYPQDPIITDYCDKNGILVSMEIPLDHEISDHPDYGPNCKHMVQEMIHQYYNHPSVIIWAYMNEMGLWKDAKKDSLHMTKVADLARELESQIRKTDPYRYTMMPNHGYFDIYPEFGLTEIPMIIGWNLYYGWYVPDINGFGAFVDRAHKLVPDKPMIISEYGVGADPRITSFDPQRFDFSLNYSLDFHRSHLAQILERDFIAGSAVWNMFDFGSETRNDAVPHVNNKGLCSFDRKPKAAFYVYQDHLRPEIGVEIPFPGPDYILKAASDFSSIPERFNGKVYTLEEYWQNHSVLSINFGTDFYFDHNGMNWLPDTGLPGDFYIQTGGERAKVRDYGIGTSQAISLTELDPVYQTWQDNPDELLFWIPDGNYRLIIHLSNNSQEIHDGFIINAERNSTLRTGSLESYKAYRFETELKVKDGLTLEFEGEHENSFINGIQFIRL